MAELSLQGHESALEEIADESIMTEGRLEMHLIELDQIWRDATAKHIGRQAEVAARLLTHFTFEKMTRDGATPEEIREAVAAYRPVEEPEYDLETVPATV